MAGFASGGGASLFSQLYVNKLDYKKIDWVNAGISSIAGGFNKPVTDLGKIAISSTIDFTINNGFRNVFDNSKSFDQAIIEFGVASIYSGNSMQRKILAPESSRFQYSALMGVMSGSVSKSIKDNYATEIR